MQKHWVAMGVYAILAIVAWNNLTERIPHSQFEVRHVVLVILGALAVLTWLHRNPEQDGAGAKK